MQMVVIQNSIIYSFVGSLVVINILIFLGASGDREIEPDVSVGFRINIVAIGRWGTFFLAGVEVGFMAGKNASVYNSPS